MDLAYFLAFRQIALYSALLKDSTLLCCFEAATAGKGLNYFCRFEAAAAGKGLTDEPNTVHT